MVSLAGLAAPAVSVTSPVKVLSAITRKTVSFPASFAFGIKPVKDADAGADSGAD
jgi:hypothetical protein